MAIVEASNGKVGSPVDSLLLYCYHYDPMTGRYGLAIMRAIRVAGAATVLALGAFIVIMVASAKPSAESESRRPTTRCHERHGRLIMWSGTPLFPEQRLHDGRRAWTRCISSCSRSRCSSRC